MFQSKAKRILGALILIGLALHFYNISWGAPLFFHPDERNIANAVTQMHFPNQLNPNFFAYGSLPIYVIFFTGLLSNFFTTFDPNVFSQPLSFPNAIIISRVYSALFATLLIPLLYFIGAKLKDKTTGIIAAFLATFSTGFIQFAHFGTFEMWLTFFSVLLFWTCISFMETHKLRDLFFISICAAILLCIKISSLALLPLPLLAIVIRFTNDHKNTYLKKTLLTLGSLFILLMVTVCIFILTNPFVFIDTKAFLASMEYESSVGFNTLPVFYTQGFYDTAPVLYQFLHIYPFLLNPFVTILFVGSLAFIISQIVKTRNRFYVLLLAFFAILFLSQSVLFIKWTRYMVPTLPFIFLFVAIALSSLQHRKHNTYHTRTFAYRVTGIVCVVFSMSYFITAFVQPDTRINAVEEALQVIPPDARIITEPYDLGTTAFQRSFSNITEFNTYDLDGGSNVYTLRSWQQAIDEAEVILLPSQRVLQSRITNPKQFPNGHVVYTKLLEGKAGYQKMYETPCDIFCQIAYLGDPIYHFEQTANVFDRPTVMIFRKLY